MAEAGHPMKIVQGLRTQAQQAALYAQGRSTSGPIVTQCDGVHTRSNHQAQADGLGHAVDCAFEGPVPFAESHPWALYGSKVRGAGLSWGGDWAHPDRPHAELAKKP